MTLTLPENWVDDVGAGLADLYRDLHAHPELSFQEHRTAQKVQEAIDPLGLDVTAGVGRTGVVGVLRNGPGPVVWLRADFDALPVREQTGLPYASTARGNDADGHDVPVMHACGHDMHVAALVGALTGGVLFRLVALAAPLWLAAVLLVACAAGAYAATRRPQSLTWR